MYPCPNCRAGLRFDIPSQKLFCDHCDSSFDPYKIGKEKDAVERDTFEVKIFTCPQCGGELIADDDTAATFCSYCGGTTVLDSRISEERKPAAIIPFKKTKEDCKAAYSEMVKHAIYSPSAFKDSEHLEKFRGIYMPYWMYDFTTDGFVDFEGTTSNRRGDYIYTKHYEIKGDVKGAADGITFDASSTFPDDISAQIAPFDMKESMKFTPSYFSGFYADTGDVDKAVYADDAREMVKRFNEKEVLATSDLAPLTIDSANREKIRTQADADLRDVNAAMLPVWFLSYKTADKRMAYAFVNGQTGKVVADLPVERKKFLLFSGITTLVLFAIFSLLFTPTPGVTLFIVLAISIIIFIMATSQLSKLIKKENYENDQGMLYKKAEMQSNRKDASTDEFAVKNDNEYIAAGSSAFRAASVVNYELANQNLKKKKAGKGNIILSIVLTIASLVVFSGILPEVLIDLAGLTGFTEQLVSVAGFVIAVTLSSIFWMNLSKTGSPFKTDFKMTFSNVTRKSSLLLPIISIAVAVFVLVLEPVQDMYYYGAAIFCIAVILITEIQLIERYNKLTTRKPPQLGRRGGDENA